MEDYLKVLVTYRRCPSCWTQMQPIRYDTVLVCEPPLIVNQYNCNNCGYWERVTFEDDYLQKKVNILRIKIKNEEILLG